MACVYANEPGFDWDTLDHAAGYGEWWESVGCPDVPIHAVPGKGLTFEERYRMLVFCLNRGANSWGGCEVELAEQLDAFSGDMRDYSPIQLWHFSGFLSGKSLAAFDRELRRLRESPPQALAPKASARGNGQRPSEQPNAARD